MTRAPWVSHFGFTRTPFSKSIPASQLCDRSSHQEAVARIRFDQAGTRQLTAGAAVVECRRRRLEARGSVRAQPARFALTLGIAVETAP